LASGFVISSDGNQIPGMPSFSTYTRTLTSFASLKTGSAGSSDGRMRETLNGVTPTQHCPS
jgi:hypothetical protein